MRISLISKMSKPPLIKSSAGGLFNKKTWHAKATFPIGKYGKTFIYAMFYGLSGDLFLAHGLTNIKRNGDYNDESLEDVGHFRGDA